MWVTRAAVLASAVLSVCGIHLLVSGKLAAPEPVATSVPTLREKPAQSGPAESREGAMLPLQDWWFGGWLGWGGDGARRQPRPLPRQRGYFHAPVDDEDAGRDVRPAPRPTYRTMCVRLCDGYAFPISYSVVRDRFAKDASTCASLCGTEARLFVYRNPGGDLDDMEDLQGQPYRRLANAFLYRTEYVSSCKCRPHPWETEARERHRVYALAAAARKGDAEAKKELRSLQESMKQAAGSGTDKQAQPETAGATDDEARKRGRGSRALSDRNGTPVMRLGASGRTKAKPAAPPESGSALAGSDWKTKAYQDGH